MGLIRTTEENHRFIREHYMTMGNKEMADAIGQTPQYVYQYRKRHGLAIPPDVLARAHCGFAKVYEDPEYARQMQERAAEGRRKMIKMERFRIMSGLKQQTRMPLTMVPLKIRKRIHNLCRQYNYYKCDDSLKTATIYYDSHTRRSRYEYRDTAKYGIKFVQGDEEEEQTTEEQQ